jgi:hypothetical protein
MCKSLSKVWISQPMIGILSASLQDPCFLEFSIFLGRMPEK